MVPVKPVVGLASLSVLSAGIFKVTGSFRLATYGLQALLAQVRGGGAWGWGTG